MSAAFIGEVAVGILAIGGIAVVIGKRGGTQKDSTYSSIRQIGKSQSSNQDDASLASNKFDSHIVESEVRPAPESAIERPLSTESPESVVERSSRLRDRFGKSQSSISLAFRQVFSSGVDNDVAWEELEDTLIIADLGARAATQIVDELKQALRKAGPNEDIKSVVRDHLVRLIDGGFSRELATTRHEDRPAVVLTVGVNGTGKTTTTGKLARLLVAQDKEVLLGAADTFRAAATHQLQTWGERVGAIVVSGPEGGDPASVAFDAVNAGVDGEVDVVLIDTAGRLHTKQGLMDELGKVYRVASKAATVDEVLLVIDATTGQNGLTQARVFSEVVPVTGIVLTKLDGTAKGGIVVAVQQELGVPVKLVGLGEGPDDLAVFDPIAFVDGLIN